MNKTEPVVYVRVTQDEKAAWEAVQKREGFRSLSEFLRQTVRKYLDTVLAPR